MIGYKAAYGIVSKNEGRWQMGRCIIALEILGKVEVDEAGEGYNLPVKAYKTDLCRVLAILTKDGEVTSRSSIETLPMSPNNVLSGSKRTRMYNVGETISTDPEAFAGKSGTYFWPDLKACMTFCEMIAPMMQRILKIERVARDPEKARIFARLIKDAVSDPKGFNVSNMTLKHVIDYLERC